VQQHRVAIIGSTPLNNGSLSVCDTQAPVPRHIFVTHRDNFPNYTYKQWVTLLKVEPPPPLLSALPAAFLRHCLQIADIHE
jgi:hypothetical protein